MTKTYPIVQLGEYLYALDKEAEIKEGDKVYRHYDDGGSHIGDSLPNSDNLKKDRVWKIIATSNPSLGIYLLPKIEEDWYKTSEEYSKKIKSGNTTEEFISKMQGFIDGYKAASSKKYSQDDIDKAIASAYKACNMSVEGSKSFAPDVLISRNFLEQYLKSLTPVPKAIEVEMEDLPVEETSHKTMWNSPSCRPKTKENTVIGRYII